MKNKIQIYIPLSSTNYSCLHTKTISLFYENIVYVIFIRPVDHQISAIESGRITEHHLAYWFLKVFWCFKKSFDSYL